MMPHTPKTPIVPSRQGHEAAEPSLRHQSETLDEGLDESFPASDPVAVTITRIILASASRRKNAPRAGH